MKIAAANLNLWADSARVNDKSTFTDEKSSKAGGEGFRDDMVTVSFTAQKISESSKLSTVLSNAIIRDFNGQETERGYQRNSIDNLRIEELYTPNDIDSPQEATKSTSISTVHQFHEDEQMSFFATGSIAMTDGRQVEFSLEMLMQREYDLLEKDLLEITPAIAGDPLVINFSGSSLSLTEAKYTFDLDSDGEVEEMSFVGSGSGFLALDLNEDGQINNGRELFGPDSGNGFSDLQAYDQDLNGWIDESDDVFSQLSVWTKDGTGADRLQSLKELGVGAISLENTETTFSITNHKNEFQGQVRRSSVLLKEDGSVYTMQQVDLDVKKKLKLQPLDQAPQLVTQQDKEQIKEFMRIQAERGDGGMFIKEGSGLSIGTEPVQKRPSEYYLFRENQTMVANSTLYVKSEK